MPTRATRRELQGLWLADLEISTIGSAHAIQFVRGKGTDIRDTRVACCQRSLEVREDLIPASKHLEKGVVPESFEI